MNVYSTKTAGATAARPDSLNRKGFLNFKGVSIFTALLLASQLSYAQFSIEFGGMFTMSGHKKENVRQISSSYFSTKPDTSYYSYKYGASGAGIYVYPKIGLVQVANHSISFGLPIDFGFSGSANSQTGESESSFLIDLNCALDINGGKFNKKNDNNPFFGYYVGLGYGLTNTNGVDYELHNDGSIDASTPNLVMLDPGQTADDKFKAKTSGLLIHAGIGGFSDIKFLSHLGLRASYRLGSSTKLSYTSVCIFMHF